MATIPTTSCPHLRISSTGVVVGCRLSPRPVGVEYCRPAASGWGRMRLLAMRHRLTISSDRIVRYRQLPAPCGKDSRQINSSRNSSSRRRRHSLVRMLVSVRTALPRRPPTKVPTQRSSRLRRVFTLVILPTNSALTPVAPSSSLAVLTERVLLVQATDRDLEVEMEGCTSNLNISSSMEEPRRGVRARRRSLWFGWTLRGVCNGTTSRLTTTPIHLGTTRIPLLRHPPPIMDQPQLEPFPIISVES